MQGLQCRPHNHRYPRPGDESGTDNPLLSDEITGCQTPEYADIQQITARVMCSHLATLIKTMRSSAKNYPFKMISLNQKYFQTTDYKYVD